MRGLPPFRELQARLPSLLSGVRILLGSGGAERLLIPLRGVQFTLGFGAYLYPTVAKRHREALGPLHTYLGKATFIAGLANMAVCSSLRIAALGNTQLLYSSPW